ncbi:hypothetical protein ACUR5C_14600 [Aliikangiella sp. IMCC44653]
MDFEELKTESKQDNVKKNRLTLVLLFAIFVVPVAVAYSAYFAGWFAGATKNKGELLVEAEVLDVEDFAITRSNGEKITGKEFETLYWWIVPIDPRQCDQACITLNIVTVNQTYIGLGKQTQKAEQLLVLPNGSQFDTGPFPTAFAEFSQIGIKALPKTASGLNKDLPANFIYLVDPLGNIILRYPLVKDKSMAPQISRDMREDIRRLFKYSRLG